MSLDVEESDVAFKLASGDGSEFEIPIEAARQSVILTKVLSSDSSARSFQCVGLDSTTLGLVAEYLRQHLNNPARPIEKPLKNSKIREVLSEWDYAFIMPLLVGNCKGLFDLMLAANYLDIKPLFDMCCATMAAIMKTKPPEQVAGMLGVDINLSHREWEDLRKENSWAEAADLPTAEH